MEEVVVNTDPVKRKDRGPDIGERLFDGVAWRDVTGLTAGHVRSGQCLAVDLAIGSQGQLRQHDEVDWHHVFGQRARNGGAQVCRIGSGFIFPGDNIGDEPLVVVHVLAYHDDGIADSRQCEQGGFNLAGLDPEATDLDLIVDAAEILDVAIWQEAGEVTGPVHPGAGQAERVGDELLGSEFGAVLRHQ